MKLFCSRKHYHSRQPLGVVCTLCQRAVSITNGKKHFTRHHKRVKYTRAWFERPAKMLQPDDNAEQAELLEDLDIVDVEGQPLFRCVNWDISLYSPRIQISVVSYNTLSNDPPWVAHPSPMAY